MTVCTTSKFIFVLYWSGSPSSSRSTHGLIVKRSSRATLSVEAWERTVLLAHLTLMMMEWQRYCRSLHINKEANQTDIRINAWTLLVVLPVGFWPACPYVSVDVSDRVKGTSWYYTSQADKHIVVEWHLWSLQEHNLWSISHHLPLQRLSLVNINCQAPFQGGILKISEDQN